MESISAFAAGKVDAVAITNGDVLVTSSAGVPSVVIVINDYSNGKDVIVAHPNINSVAGLKGKKIGVEIGTSTHLLLIMALRSVGYTEEDVVLINILAENATAAIANGSVDALVSGSSLSRYTNLLSRANVIYSSADVPGLIYDVLAVNPSSLSCRNNDWMKVTEVWYKIADFLNPSLAIH